MRHGWIVGMMVLSAAPALAEPLGSANAGAGLATAASWLAQTTTITGEAALALALVCSALATVIQASRRKRVRATLS